MNSNDERDFAEEAYNLATMRDEDELDDQVAPPGHPAQRTAEQDRQWSETAGCITRGTYAPEREAQAHADLIAKLPPGNLNPGDPIPPERTGGMTGFVTGECGHRLAASEWRAGFRNCERCGAESVFRLTDAASRSLGCE